MNILSIGCGKMGSIIINNLLEQGILHKEISIIEKSDDNKISKLKYYKSCLELPKSYQADVVFIAIKPQNSKEILTDLFVKSAVKFFHKNTIFISILAGKKISFFEKIFGKNAKIIRSMPNLPIQDSQGIFTYLANKNIKNNEVKKLQKIFNNFGEVLKIDDEKLFDVITAIFGSGPAYIFYLQEIFTEIAISCKIDKNKAANLVKTLFLGSALMSCNSKLDFSKLQESVTSKGGTTEAALKTLKKDSALKTLFTKAIKEATTRSKELSE